MLHFHLSEVVMPSHVPLSPLYLLSAFDATSGIFYAEVMQLMHMQGREAGSKAT